MLRPAPRSHSAQTDEPEVHPAPSGGITLRATLAGLALLLPNAYWITIDEVRWYTLDGTSLPLFITPVFFLFCVCLLNSAAARYWPLRMLSQGELLTIYIVLVAGSLIASHDLVQNLFGAIAHADRYATTANRYENVFFRYLDPLSFLLVRDKTAVEGFYNGSVSWTDPRLLGPFLGPLFWWGVFLLVLIGMCLCVGILIRKAWTQHEKLAFPIVQLPIAMTQPDRTGARFWKSRAMWWGFVTAAAIDTVNGMHYLYPSWPYLEQVKLYDIGQFFTTRPWNAVGQTWISMYPFAIGLAFFLPLDLCFSCWFFYVARKLFQIVGAAYGWDASTNVGFPYFEQQASGAWIMLGALVLWSLRTQFGAAWRLAWSRSPHVEDPGERTRYRVAFVGLAASAVFLVWFSNRIQLAPWAAAVFFGLFLLLAIAITRVRAEFGSPHEIYFVSPRTVMVSFFGVTGVGAQNLTALSVLYWFNRGYRAHPMPNQLEAFKMAEVGRMQTGRLIALLIAVAALGIVCAYIANLHITFANGANARSVGFKWWVGSESFDRLNGWLQTPTKPTTTQLAYTGGGAMLVLALRVMRSAFLWWPFHPIGYALAVSYAMDYFWFAFLIGYILKLAIVRAGGMRSLNAASPFFLGLVLGDYVLGSLWSLYGPLMGLQVYKVFV